MGTAVCVYVCVVEDGGKKVKYKKSNLYLPHLEINK